MKIVRCLYKKEVIWAILEGQAVRVLKVCPFNGSKKLEFVSEPVPLSKVKLLAPVLPGKIICAGLNYRDHARELGMKIPSQPVIFLKPASSIIGHKDKIIYPKGVKKLDYEAELAIVIGRKAKSILPSQVNKYILGYTCLNDITARDLQNKDIQWTRAKSFDTFCPIGPWIETKLDFSKEIRVKSWLNGKLKQNASISNFIFSIEYLVSFVSKIMTLLPGDIISTGTPSGIGRMKRTDIIEVEIEGIGKLTNYLV